MSESTLTAGLRLRTLIGSVCLAVATVALAVVLAGCGPRRTVIIMDRTPGKIVVVEKGHSHTNHCGHYHHNGNWYHAKGHSHGKKCGHKKVHGKWVSH